MIKFIKSEKGFGLIEVLMSLALFSIIAVAFLMAIASSLHAVFVVDERNVAEGLAKSQMEFIKEQDYIYEDLSDEVPDAVYLNIKESNEEIGNDPQYSSFIIGSVVIDEYGVETAVDDIRGIPWNTDPNYDQPNSQEVGDVGLQKIKLIICNNVSGGVSLDDYVLILEDFKVDR